MSEQPFSNRELNAIFRRIDEKLDAIVTQTTKTNGRMNKAEDNIHTLETKQEGLAIKVGAIVFVASTTFVYLLNKILGS